jgi:cytoskeletal protein CcmA (bactofilin family)
MKRILSLVLSVFIFSSTYSSNFEAGDEVVIESAINGNAYLSGGNIRIKAPIDGDLVAAGGELSVQDSISGDLLLAGGRIEINGFVDDDARISGGEIVVSNIINGDLVVFGGLLRITEEAHILGDVICFAGEVSIYGKVDGAVKIYAGEVSVKNEIGGDAEIQAGEIEIAAIINGDATMSAQDIDFEESAKVLGSLTYWSGDGEEDLAHVCSDVTFDEDLAYIENEKDWSMLIAALGFGLIAYWTVFIMAAFLILVILEYLFSKYFNQAASIIKDSFIKSFGYGMLYFVGIPVLILISFVIIIGIPIGLFTLSVYLLSLLFASAFIGLTVSHYFKNRSNSDWTHMQTLGYALLTVVIIKIIFWIPLLGQLVKTVAMSTVYGAFLLMLFERQRKKSDS